MDEEKKDLIDEFAEELGADRVIPLNLPKSRGPLDLLHLLTEVKQRLRSAGGRPSDPLWTVKRLVPFKAQSWKELEELTERFEKEGQHVSPAQVAAILIEHGLKDLLGKELTPCQRKTTVSGH